MKKEPKASEAKGSAAEVKRPRDAEGNRQQMAAARLTALAQRLGPGEQLPTFAQLRQELDVSVTTLVGVLNDLESRGVLVRRHGVGIFVARDVNTRHVALLCDPRFFYSDGYASPFWLHFVAATWQRANERGQTLALHFVAADVHDKPVSSDGAPASLGDMLTSDLRQGRIQGVLGAGLSACAVVWLTRLEIPLVAFAGYAPHCVVMDVELTAQRGVEALAARGCRRIGLWTASLLDSPIRVGYQRALKMLGLPLDPSLVWGGERHPSPKTPLQQGEQAALAVFGPDGDPAKRPDGVFLGEDTLARGALPTLIRLGIRVGADLPVASHTNAGSPLLYGFEDGLIRIETDPARLVAEMYALLEAQLEGRASSQEMVTLAPIVRLPGIRV